MTFPFQQLEKIGYALWPFNILHSTLRLNQFAVYNELNIYSTNATYCHVSCTFFNQFVYMWISKASSHHGVT